MYVGVWPGWMTSVVLGGQGVTPGTHTDTHILTESHTTAAQLVLADVTGIKGGWVGGAGGFEEFG